MGEKTKELWKDPKYRKMMSDAHKGNPKNKGAYTWTKENCPQVVSQEFRDKLSKDRMRSGNPNWNGGEQVDTNGYKKILTGNKEYTFEHRLVMEEYLGRKLKPEEVVHHIDGDRLNNNIDNLQLFDSVAEHTAHHHKLRKEGGAE